MSTVTKRTRSQLTLIDMGSRFPLNRSPLKAARQAARNNMATSKSEPSRLRNPISDEKPDEEDELLLSPGRSNPKKRSSSPLDEERPFGEDDTERASKKVKRDNDEGELNAPPPPKPLGPFDFASISPSKSIFPSQSGTFDYPRKRAQSVPAQSPSIPHIDFKQVPASPHRAPSSSPQRPRLRFTSVPHDTERPRPVDEDTRMNVDEPVLASTPHASRLNIYIPTTTPFLTHDQSVGRPPSPLTPLSPTLLPHETPSDSSQADMDDTRRIEPLRLLPHDNPATPKAHSAQPALAEGHIVPLEDVATPKAAPPPAPDTTPTADTPSVDSPSVDSPSVDPPCVSGSMAVDRVPDVEPVSEPSLSTVASRPSSALSVSRIPRPSTHSRSLSLASDSSLSSAGPSIEHASQPKPQAAIPKKPVSRVPRERKAPPHGPPRVTRSVSQKQKKVAQVGRNDSANGNASAGTSTMSVPSQSTSHPTVPGTTDGNAVAGPSKAAIPIMSALRPTTPGLSHKKSYTSSFAQPTSSSLSKAVEKSPVKKPVSLPRPLSPTKPASPKKPSSSMNIMGYMKAKQSSLSTLSNALERLKMPPPARPGTHLGFAHGAEKPAISGAATKDDVDVGRTSAAAAGKKSATGLQRANTMGPMSSAFSSKSGLSSTSRPSAAFAAPRNKGRINLGSSIVVGKSAFTGAGGSKLFGGVGNGRPAQRVSKKSSLPMVEGSPVKGGAQHSSDRGGRGKGEDEKMEGPSTSREIKPMDLAGLLKGDDSLRMDLDLPGASMPSLLSGDNEPIPEGHDAWKHNASRRASMASQLLSHTLSELPQTPPRPPSRAAKEDTRPRRSGSPARLKTLRSASGGNAVAMKSAPGALGKGAGEGSHVAAGKTASEDNSEASGSGTGTGAAKAAGSGEKVGSLKVLKKCTIFVDVRTDEGDDAGALFVDMLKGLGARVIGRAGQSCTHIVYKNGQTSTLTKYRLMSDPKPFVVGIAWVVECVEQRKRVDEERFLVNLEFAHVAGANKRRRSMLPKHMLPDMTPSPMQPPPVPSGSGGTPSSGEQSMDANVSMDGSESSATSSRLGADDDDNLPPLERARRRRSMMLKFATSGR